MNSTWTVLVLIVAVLAVLLGQYINDQNNIAEKFVQNIKYKKMDRKLTALVLGGTGAVGKGIVKALAESPEFEKVTLFGRRSVELPNATATPNYLKFDQKLIDFDNLTKNREDFKGYDAAFCALGVTSSDPNHYRISHDYVVETAKLAKEGGVKIFHYVSASGASSTSWLKGTLVKGQTEEELAKLDFDRLAFYRPALVLTEKKEDNRCMYNVMQSIDRAIDPWNLASVEATVMGRVMVKNTFQDTEEKVQIFENKVMNKLGKEMESKKST